MNNCSLAACPFGKKLNIRQLQTRHNGNYFMQKSTKNVDRKNTFMKISIISLHGYIQYCNGNRKCYYFWKYGTKYLKCIFKRFLKEYLVSFSAEIPDDKYLELRIWMNHFRNVVFLLYYIYVNARFFSFIIYRRRTFPICRNFIRQLIIYYTRCYTNNKNFGCVVMYH